MTFNPIILTLLSGILISTEKKSPVICYFLDLSCIFAKYDINKKQKDELLRAKFHIYFSGRSFNHK